MRPSAGIIITVIWRTCVRQTVHLPAKSNKEGSPEKDKAHRTYWPATERKNQQQNKATNKKKTKQHTNPDTTNKYPKKSTEANDEQKQQEKHVKNTKAQQAGEATKKANQRKDEDQTK